MYTKLSVTGMTCSSCEEKVKNALITEKSIVSILVNKDLNQVTLEHQLPLSISQLQSKLDPKYTISHLEKKEQIHTPSNWFATYKPVLLLFTYILGVTLLIQFNSENVDWMEWMRHFMAGFFLLFSFFKLLDLQGFASSYAMYDIVAKKFPNWGYIYAFIELSLGFAYLTNFAPFFTNAFTTFVMTISIIGVLQTVLKKQKIKCACLGSVFNLPMSTLTIIEDGVMIVMSASMLAML